MAALIETFDAEQIPTAWRVLFGGRTNTAWHGMSPAGDVVVKLYAGAAQNPLFPNDPESEAHLLRSLRAEDFVPQFLAKMPTDIGMCTVYSHVPGRMWHTGSAQVAELMRKVHSQPIPKGLRRTPNGSDALTQQILKIVGQCQVMPDLLVQLPNQTIPPCAHLVLLHTDIVPGNLISNDNGLHLIDWQCPAMGDPCDDIAVFLSPAMQFLYRGAALEESEIVEFFVGYNKPDVAARWRMLAPFFHARMAAYCLWQLENGRPDYEAGLALEVAAFHKSITSITA